LNLAAPESVLHDRELLREPSEGSVSFEPLVSLHGPDENMQGKVMDAGLRANLAAQEDVALGKMRRFCASILKKLAPPLLREIESSSAQRQLVEPATPRRLTRAAGAASLSVTAARKGKRASAAETVLLKALGITEPQLEVNDEALQEFQELFDSPVREQHLRAMAAIFGKSVPSATEAQAAGVLGILVQ
jgi:hypothetical protein